MAPGRRGHTVATTAYTQLTQRALALRPPLRKAVLGVCAAAAYYAAATLGLELSVARGLITPVWPAAGIALAALLLFGPRLWPAIVAGAFLSNVTHGASPEVAAAIACGNTLSALAGYGLLRRAHFRLALDRSRDVIALVLLAAIGATTIAATVGVTSLALSGADDASPYGTAWSLWWLGDAMGVLLVAPAILVWATMPLRPRRAEWVEALTLPALIAAASAAIYLGGLWRYPYPLFPLLVWATLRFRQRGAATGSLLVAAIAVAGAVGGETPLGDSTTIAVRVVQGLLAFVAVSLLILGATLAERDKAEHALRHTAENLAEAQELASVGSWEWELATGRFTWSTALYRMFELAPDGPALDYAGFLERVDDHDRGTVDTVIQRARRDHQPFEVTYTILLEGGRNRVLLARGRVDVDESGRAVRMSGTSQDVTERHHLDRLRENILSSVSHELRTPLASILGFSLTLKERGDEISEATRREIVDQLTTQSLRLERLLSDLLDVDRLRHGRLQLDRARTNVTALVGLVAATAEAPRGTTIEVRGADVYADVDAPKVERIVANLLGNAVKHTPAGATIEVSVTADERGVLIRVDDDGPGIPEAQKREIFELFARGVDPNAPGTGVGLALVAQFAALQGGRVWVEDGPAGGASFRVLLPTLAAGEIAAR